MLATTDRVYLMMVYLQHTRTTSLLVTSLLLNEKSRYIYTYSYESSYLTPGGVDGIKIVCTEFTGYYEKLTKSCNYTVLEFT